MFEGKVEAIALRKVKSGAVELTPSAAAEADRGLVGDHAHTGLPPGVVNTPDRQITLIEAEALEAVQHETGDSITHLQSRRNILTRGAPLNHLVGRRFRVGEVLLEGVELCEPCSHLEKLNGKLLIKPFLHRCGLRARIVESGTIHVGDVIREA